MTGLPYRVKKSIMLGRKRVQFDMKIIKHGVQKEDITKRMFSCDSCGCLFNANRSEYKLEEKRVCATCKCPECGNIAREVI